MEVICNRNQTGGCGFRVHDRYFEEKIKRFSPGVCPRCAGPVIVVESGTDTPVIGKSVNRTSGRVE